MKKYYYIAGFLCGIVFSFVIGAIAAYFDVTLFSGILAGFALVVIGKGGYNFMKEADIQ